MISSSCKAARGRARVCGAIVFASLLWSISPPVMAQAPSPTPESREAWHESMVRTPLPKQGCFKASYPDTEWQEVPCTTPPSYPLLRTRFGGIDPDTVGGGGSNDYAAQAASGLISTAVGSFMSVTPGITEMGKDPTGKTSANTFSLQLNTNTFTTPACENGGAGCLGWQQFAFVNDGGSATAMAYIQYWLLNYGPTCPNGWTNFPNSNNCYFSPNAASIPVQTMADLAQMTLAGAAVSGGMDMVTLTTPGDHLYAVSAADGVLGLAQGWQAAEFNIFGDSVFDSQPNEAKLSSGSTIVVKVSVGSGTADAPYCAAESLTGETDSLALVSPCCPYGGASPAIEFMESNAASPAAACFSSLQAFTVLASFNGTDGLVPYAGLVQATNGDLYGTTYYGGANNNCAPFDGCGTVFKITPSGTLTTLYSFCSKSGCPDGSEPSAGLVQATNGDLYGTTNYGGANCAPYGCGTVFKITPSGTLTTLYSFCSKTGCTDGYNPYAGLVQASNGDLYGTTLYGAGTYGYGGTVFKITPSGTLTTLYSFCSKSGCTDGSEPYAGLVKAANGDLYGTTFNGGANSEGTVFKITPSGTLTTLYSFCSQSGCTDGNRPVAGLVQATNGDLYGTTNSDGAEYTGGTVFKITPSGTLTTLYSFCSQSQCPDGQGPGGLVQATDGNLYGTTLSGGAYSVGTVFEITPSGALTTLYSFCYQTNCTDGEDPNGLVQATNGDLYGTTEGTVFSLYVGLGPFVETLPTSGKVGATVKILGTNLTGATSVSFDGTGAVFEVVSSSEITTTVPTDATTGTVQVVTPNGTLSSNVPFRVP
jgi:uncharacterized repeat protein (TIGR03803 family)